MGPWMLYVHIKDISHAKNANLNHSLLYVPVSILHPHPTFIQISYTLHFVSLVLWWITDQSGIYGRGNKSVSTSSDTDVLKKKTISMEENDVNQRNLTSQPHNFLEKLRGILEFHPHMWNEKLGVIYVACTYSECLSTQYLYYSWWFSLFWLWVVVVMMIMMKWVID